MTRLSDLKDEESRNKLPMAYNDFAELELTNTLDYLGQQQGFMFLCRNRKMLWQTKSLSVAVVAEPVSHYESNCNITMMRCGGCFLGETFSPYPL